MNATNVTFKKRSALAEGLLNMGKAREAEDLFYKALDLAVSEGLPEKNKIPALDGLGRSLFEMCIRDSLHCGYPHDAGRSQ